MKSYNLEKYLLIYRTKEELFFDSKLKELNELMRFFFNFQIGVGIGGKAWT